VHVSACERSRNFDSPNHVISFDISSGVTRSNFCGATQHLRDRDDPAHDTLSRLRVGQAYSHSHCRNPQLHNQTLHRYLLKPLRDSFDFESLLFTMPSRLSNQDSFAANLESQSRGLAVYRPFQVQAHSRRVGDIAFFDSQGIYRWIHNALHSTVRTRSDSPTTEGTGIA
jgi:hypothetical protein